MRILLVDDNMDMLNALSDLLKLRNDYEVYACSSAAAAFKYLEYLEVDLIITDLIMPGMNGADFVNKVRSQFASPPEFLMVTGSLVEDVLDQLHVDAPLLQKPFGSRELFRRVDLIRDGQHRMPPREVSQAG